jgi:hypothetical protein
MKSPISQLFELMHGANILDITTLDLLSLKKSRLALVCGSGPSLLDFVHTKGGLDQYDVIGTSHTALLDQVHGTLFYEPIFSGEGINPNFGDIYLAISEACLQSHIAAAISSLKSKLTILINPQFPSVRTADSFAYLTPLLDISVAYLPPYFFVNESNDARILCDLRRYAQSSHDALLNFRCSMVRALSLCYLLEYEEIILTGLDPSSPNYWYTLPEAKDLFNPKIGSHLMHLCALKGELIAADATRTEHEGEYYSSYFGMNFSIWFAIRILDLWAKNRGSRLPTILYYGHDHKSLNYLKEARLESRIKHIPF